MLIHTYKALIEQGTDTVPIYVTTRSELNDVDVITCYLYTFSMFVCFFQF